MKDFFEKQVVEVPIGSEIVDVETSGNKAILTLKKRNLFEVLRDTDSVVKYMEDLSDKDVEWAVELYREFSETENWSYSESVLLYQLVVGALTNGEKWTFKECNRWSPMVNILAGKREDLPVDMVVGLIESGEQVYTVVEGQVQQCSATSISVPSREIAEHITRYFGKLFFDVVYGGPNSNYKWV